MSSSPRLSPSPLNPVLITPQKSLRTQDEESSLVTASCLVQTGADYRLPVELLTEIFLFIFFDRAHTRQQVLNIVMLSGVCSHWRTIVLQTPRLWTMEIPLPWRDPIESRTELFRVFLERSAPLAIPVNPNPTRELPAILLDILLSVRHRWKSLELWHNLDTICALPVHPAPLLLEEISLGDHNRLDERKARQLAGTAFFQHAPRLVRARLHLLHAHKFVLPWTQLHTLDLSGPDSQTCLAIIEQCTALVRLDLDITSSKLTPVHTRSGVPTPFTLPLLEEMTLEIWFLDPQTAASASPSDLFARLNAPALQDLHILQKNYLVEYEGPDWLSSPAFRSFLTRTPAIDSFELYGSTISADSLRTLLELMPNLAVLHLENCNECINASSLRALTFLPGSDSAGGAVPLVPQLRLFKYTGPLDHASAVALSTMIRSRWWDSGPGSDRKSPPPPPVTRLNSVWITSFMHSHMHRRRTIEYADACKLTKELSPLQSQGLNVELWFYGGHSGYAQQYL